MTLCRTKYAAYGTALAVFKAIASTYCKTPAVAHVLLEVFDFNWPI